MDNTLTGLCRITVRAPDASYELAVPTDVPLGDLLPEIVRHAGPGVEEAGLAHQGWVLQRLGDEPIDDDATLAAAGLHDGDTVYLRGRADQLPPVHFDDLVDGIAATLRGRRDAWRPAATRCALLVSTAGVIAASLVVIGLALSGATRVGLAAGVAVLLWLGAGAASRAVGDRAAGLLLGIASVPYLALAGALVTSGTGAMLGARLLAGTAAAAGAAVLALGAVGTGTEVFLALAGLCGIGVVGGAAIVVTGASPVGAAGLSAVLVELLTLLVPMLGLRMSGLRIPPLPRNADELQEGIEPHPGQDVVARATQTHAYTTAFLLAGGVVLLVSLTALAARWHWDSYALAAALSLLCLLHSRSLAGRWQRLAMLVPGTYGVLLLGALLAVRLPASWHLPLLVALLVLGALLLLGSWSLPGARLVPYWGRAAELLHTLFALSLVPLLFALLGGYAWARTLF
ncbi:MAG TPA: type VII secretion integral membrane protein EccD [Actinocatenispora sp.]